jgi:hypothetical protein
MTTALLTPPTARTVRTAQPEPLFRAARLVPATPAADPAPSGPALAASRPETTLADVISAAWEGLVSARGAECIVCGGHMSPRYGASGPAPVGGRCDSCGSTLG